MDLDEIVTDFVNYLALISVEVCTRWSKVELLVYIQAPFELVAVTFKYFEICGIDIRLCKSQLGRVCTSLLEIVDETSDYGVSKACYLGWGPSGSHVGIGDPPEAQLRELPKRHWHVGEELF